MRVLFCNTIHRSTKNGIRCFSAIMVPIIEVEHLQKDYGNFKAVSDLSFHVEQGDVYGFLGQNGAGKSTTIRMLLTLIKPTHGSIRLFGKALDDHRQEVLKQTGAIIERPDLYKYLSAIDNLSIFARLSGNRLSNKVLLNKLDHVGLADRAHSKVKTFSQGMKQRLGIAVALVNDPQLVLLDEPTNGLDPQGIADMRRLIVSLSKEHGKTVLVSSHLLSEIEQMATRMIILHKGKKIVEGKVTELLDPANTIVECQTAKPNESILWIRQSIWKDKVIDEKDGFIRLRFNRSEIPFFSRDLINAGYDLFSLQSKNSLEDYFLSLTTGGSDERNN